VQDLPGASIIGTIPPAVEHGETLTAQHPPRPGLLLGIQGFLNLPEGPKERDRIFLAGRP